MTPTTAGLRKELADRLRSTTREEWADRALVCALLAVFDLHFHGGSGKPAPVLELVKR
jgi:hypothetical protein